MGVLLLQGLLPLKELSVLEIANAKSAGQEEHAFRITGECLSVRSNSSWRKRGLVLPVQMCTLFSALLQSSFSSGPLPQSSPSVKWG